MSTIVGFKKVIAKSNGVEYYELHLLSEDRFVTGQRAESVFCRADQISNLVNLTVGAVAEIYFNRFGKVERIAL